jgi:hypothetical protein
MVKTSSVQPPAKQGKGDAQKFTNKALPDGCQDGNRWRRIFIPTYIHFVADCENPWSVNSDKAVAAMQKIWNTVYGKSIPHTVQVNQAVFSVVCIVVFISAVLTTMARLSNVYTSGAAVSAPQHLRLFVRFSIPTTTTKLQISARSLQKNALGTSPICIAKQKAKTKRYSLLFCVI